MTQDLTSWEGHLEPVLLNCKDESLKLKHDHKLKGGYARVASAKYWERSQKAHVSDHISEDILGKNRKTTKWTTNCS